MCGLILRSNIMYQSYAWPGAYSFKGEIKLFVTWFRELFDEVLKKIDETDRKI